ncbi:MAG: GNAT family N-acetyltransferase [Rickettsia endosymbiont of Argas persicus]
MNIHFVPLTNSHFPLLLKWLEMPHVKLWWDQDIKWNIELVEQKYSSYIKEYKLQNNEPRKIQAYIIEVDQTPIGYIQIYNAHDFERSYQSINLPTKLAALDFFLGEPAYLNKGIGLLALKSFLENFVNKKFTHILVDPDSKNIAVIKTYEKAGFKIIGGKEEVLMIKENN